ncbi:MAG: c-type cytochrome [Gammaproteobacteria bacterium]|nr:c-type cytochrome [Gammaproteobacteria bacterium]MDH4254145.1 c-type cytochrome [Gammaproteobacteria bacterium]MDH5309488.1 c-type cytochrome [Gammaproteobacteria bacterium]
MKTLITATGILLLTTAALAEAPLGLPELPVPAGNPQTPAKIALGERLFNDQRFSATGDVSCATCHAPDKAFTDSPLRVSEGIRKLTGTRNAPTVVNAAYGKTQFWDGRSPDLEDQALHPFLNPVEMALPNHDALLAIVRDDRQYTKAFRDVFDLKASDITMREVTMAIAAFERTQISGDSPFDRWYFGDEEGAIGEAARRGFAVFLGNGRCVSCHTVEQDHALFTDHKFHNIGVGINDIQDRVTDLARAFQVAKNKGIDVDVAVLADANTSHLGRFVVDDELSSMGAFKTPTLRNIAVTAPYMHDGSLATLREVVEHYNNGGVTNPDDPVNAFLSGGIRPLNLTEQEIDDLVAFMEALTSPQFRAASATAALAVEDTGGAR